MNRRSLVFCLAPIIVFAAACGLDGPEPTAPLYSGDGALRNEGTAASTGLPGSVTGTQILKGHGSYLNCSPRQAAFGSALIGPAGGDLLIGPDRLIVPPGALTKYAQISGSVPANQPFRIDLEPHGLVFKKAAGLILDASSCTGVPSIVYLIDEYSTSDLITAVYSNWWHTIAAPIWHFSGYSIGMRTCDGDAVSVLDGGSLDSSDCGNANDAQQ